MRPIWQIWISQVRRKTIPGVPIIIEALKESPLLCPHPFAMWCCYSSYWTESTSPLKMDFPCTFCPIECGGNGMQKFQSLGLRYLAVSIPTFLEHSQCIRKLGLGAARERHLNFLTIFTKARTHEWSHFTPDWPIRNAAMWEYSGKIGRKSSHHTEPWEIINHCYFEPLSVQVVHIYLKYQVREREKHAEKCK